VALCIAVSPHVRAVSENYIMNHQKMQQKSGPTAQTPVQPFFRIAS
jgi:hypothetical protein